MTISMLISALAILAQGAVIWGLLRFVKSFGAYTDSQTHLANALLVAHQSNLKVHEHNLKILEELKALMVTREGSHVSLVPGRVG